MDWTDFTTLATKVLGAQPDEFQTFSRLYNSLNDFIVHAKKKDRKITVKILASLAHQKAIDFKEAIKYIQFIKSINNHKVSRAPEVQHKRNPDSVSSYQDSSNSDIAHDYPIAIYKEGILDKASAVFSMYLKLEKLRMNRLKALFTISYKSPQLFRQNSESEFKSLFLNATESLSQSYLKLLACKDYLHSPNLQLQQDRDSIISRDCEVQTDQLIDQEDETNVKLFEYAPRKGSTDMHEANQYLETSESYNSLNCQKFPIEDTCINPFFYSPAMNGIQKFGQQLSNRTTAEIVSQDIFQSLNIAKLANAMNCSNVIRLRFMAKGMNGFITNMWKGRLQSSYEVYKEDRTQFLISRMVDKLNNLWKNKLRSSLYILHSLPSHKSIETSNKTQLDTDLQTERDNLIQTNQDLKSTINSYEAILDDYKNQLSVLKSQVDASKISIQFEEPQTILCQKTQEPVKHQGMIYSIASSFDSNLAVSGSADRFIYIWNIPERKLEGALEGHTGWVYAVAISRDGKYVVSGAGDKTIRLWNIEHLKEEEVYEGHTGSVRCVAITKDNKFIVSGSTDTTIKIWTLNRKDAEDTLIGHSDCVFSVVLNSDDSTLISGSMDNTIIIWSMKSRSQLTTLYGHENSIYSVILTSDDKHMISSSADKTIKIWNLHSRIQEKVLKGHTSAVFSLAATSDSKYLISRSMDNTVIIWSIPKAKQVLSIPGSSSGISCLNITQDNKHLLVGGDDMTLRIWSLLYNQREVE